MSSALLPGAITITPPCSPPPAPAPPAAAGDWERAEVGRASVCVGGGSRPPPAADADANDARTAAAASATASESRTASDERSAIDDDGASVVEPRRAAPPVPFVLPARSAAAEAAVIEAEREGWEARSATDARPATDLRSEAACA